ncbi:hypothetical protein B0H14DRAFT_1339190 [Mycena olivaceomarginata]|nr:hypothetical protein B0H14DRAFT_1339190 [Mycena olivaceomarginata]
MIQWYRAPSSQRCSGRLAASGSSFHVCALIDMRVPFHFTSVPYFSPTLIADVPIHRQPTRVRPGYVAADFCGSSSKSAFLSARSLALPPSHSPSSCTSRAHPVPRAPLALVVLPLLRVLCLRYRPEALKRQHPRVASLLPRPIFTSSSRIYQVRAVDHDERAHLPRFSVRASRRRRRPVAAAPIEARARVLPLRLFPHATGTRA